MVVSKLPRLSEFLDVDPSPTLHNTVLFLPKANDFICVHCGETVSKLFNFNFTGKLHSEIDAFASHAILKVYGKSVELAQPFYLRYVPVLSQRHLTIEQIVLPLAADSQRSVGFLLAYVAPMDDQLEILRAAFERSQVGMIAATAVYQENGRLKDGRILLINARARAILKIPPAAKRIAFVSDLGPWFHDGALWTKIKVSAESGHTHTLYRDGHNNYYRLTIEPIDHFVLFSIIEVPKLEG